MTTLEALTETLYGLTRYRTVVTNRIPEGTVRACREISDAGHLCARPTVSVLVRAYRAEKTLDTALRGILAQKTDFPFEVIVSDDASPDGTLAVCEAWQARHPDKLRILTAERNVGLAVNDARCQAYARGAWIAECDADDEWIDPAKLQKQFALATRHNAALCVSNYLYRDIATGRLWPCDIAGATVLPVTALATHFYQNSTLFYSKAAHDRMVRDLPLPFEGDAIKQVCLAAYGPVVLLQDVTSFYNVGEGQCTGLPVPERIVVSLRGSLALAVYGPKAARHAHALITLDWIRQLLNPKAPGRDEALPYVPIACAVTRGLAARFWHSPAVLRLALSIARRARRIRRRQKRADA